MKKLVLTMLSLVAMLAAGVGLRAQEITITLYPGWNWISYPNSTVMSVNDALSAFTPMNGDKIKGQFSNSTYLNGLWRGGVTHFIPGWGYMYYSARTDVVELVFANAETSDVMVTTLEPTNIDTTSAVVGGNVTIGEGNHIFARGVCWGTEPNPTIDNSHIAGDAVAGSQSVTLDELSPSNTYYVRAYVVTDYGLAYGEELSFTTLVDHAYVDLGLPSGLLWATCNVGANAPEDYGDYFAWGETTTKSTYNWSTYQYCNGSYNTLTKYCNNSGYGYDGFTDDLTTLLPEDDAATANWGGNWRMPTMDDFEELYNNTTVIWTTQNGVNGRLFTASNGNSLFLPAAGYRQGSGFQNVGIDGNCWTSELRTDSPDYAWRFYFGSNSWNMYDYVNRDYGFPVRPVRSGSPNNAPTGAIDGKFTINENGDQVYFSQGNLQYQASTNTWKFADNQYDYVGSDNNNISSTYSGWIDLFGWGTSGYNHGAKTYQPWSTSTRYNHYYAYGDSSYNLYDQTGQADWGYNAIVNGGNQEGLGWHTLTKEEWCYVFNSRTDAASMRGHGNVNGVNGIILLPDEWTLPEGLNFTSGNSSWANVYTANQWEQMEANGAVFLPAAGYRYGSHLGRAVSYGAYWSSSYRDRNNVFLVFFFSGNLNPQRDNYRYYGYSVRLVRFCQ